MTNLPRCAREGCTDPAYTGNALSLQSSIGPLVVYVCREHFALYLQRPVTPCAEVADHRATLAVLVEAGIVPPEALEEERLP